MKYARFLVIAGLLLAVSSTASAITFLGVPQRAKFTDYTGLWRDLDGNAPLDPVPYPSPAGFVPVVPGDENRAAFYATQIFHNVLPAQSEFVDKPGTASTSGEQYAGLFYDLKALNGGIPAPAAPVTLSSAALGRTPVPGAPAGTGGVIEIYKDTGTTPTMTNFNPSPGMGAWVESDAGAVIPGRDSYPTVNQGSPNESLWLQLVFIPFPGSGIISPPGTLVNEVLDLQGTSFGEGYAMAVGGSYLSKVIPNYMASHYAGKGFGPPPAGFRADWYLKFSIDPLGVGAGPGLWLAAGEDPALWGHVPEPLTVLGVLMGVGGLAGYIRKRRMA